MPDLPYANATAGQASASDDMRRICHAFGCTKFGAWEDFGAGTVTVQFEYRGRPVQVTASAKGYAAAWLRANPWNSRRQSSDAEWQRKAYAQGQIAVWSILRDWIKGQITAVETGILSFEGAFLGQMLLPTGETVLERVQTTNLLPPPKE
jgi:hypothetical protein